VNRPGREIIEARLARMRESVDRIRKARAECAERLAVPPDAVPTLLRELQVALQACIDAGADVLIARNGDVPETYTQAFDKLGEVGILPVPLCRRLHRVAELRNRLVFRYLDEDEPARLLDDLTVLDEIEAFTGKITEYLDQSAPDP
jgi:uncharacterized protein YutE (UPF0331/DUF86 family)